LLPEEAPMNRFLTAGPWVLALGIVMFLGALVIGFLLFCTRMGNSLPDTVLSGLMMLGDIGLVGGPVAAIVGGILTIVGLIKRKVSG
jgi:hypothetical protein